MKQNYTFSKQIINKIRDELPNLEIASMEENWSKMREKLTDEQNAQIFHAFTKNPHAKRRKRYFFIAIAASVVIIFSILSVLFYNPFPGKSVEHVSGAITTDHFELSDGSLVWMNRNSKLVHPAEFKRNERQVQLTGEAYFEIQKEEKRAFKIYTGTAEILVVGTSFNIRAYSGNDTEILTVSSGKVGIRNLKSKTEKHQIINKGESCVLYKNSGKMTIYHSNNRNYLSWKTNTFEFKETRLQDVLSLLEEHFNKKFMIMSPQLEEIKINATYSKMDLESIVKTIATTLELNTVEQNDTIFVSQ